MGSEIGKLKAAAEDEPDMFDDIQRAFEKIAGKSHAQWNDAAEKATPDEAKAMADQAKRQARSLAKNALESTPTQRGKLPAHIEALIASLLAPERIPWNAIFADLLATHVTSKMQEAMNMPNGCLLNCEGFEPYPGMTLDFGFNITWIIDVSGSRSDKVFALAAAEVNQLLEKERAVHLTILQGDAACQFEQLVTNVTPPDQEEIDKLNERHACGGTVYTPMFRRVMGCDDDSDWQTERPEEPHPTPDLILVSTDGGVVIEGEVFPQLRPSCPIIWLMDPGTQAVPGMSDVAPDRVIETFEMNDND